MQHPPTHTHTRHISASSVLVPGLLRHHSNLNVFTMTKFIHELMWYPDHSHELGDSVMNRGVDLRGDSRVLE